MNTGLLHTLKYTDAPNWIPLSPNPHYWWDLNQSRYFKPLRMVHTLPFT